MKIYSILLAALLACTARAKEPPAEDATITGKDIIPACPEWVNHAVVYQIYPQTFYDSNGDGIGDLPGIIQKLDYIKSLGVDAIWINPFFDSPFNDAGYDIRDYYKIAPRYGSNDDARRLFAEAHKRGMKVLFDYVITYTSIDNPWFVASCEQKPSPLFELVRLVGQRLEKRAGQPVGPRLRPSQRQFPEQFFLERTGGELGLRQS